MSDYVKKLRNRFEFLSWSPIVFVSALKGQRLEDLKKTVNMVNVNMKRRIKTALLNEILVDICTFRPPKSFNGGIVNIKYITQSKSRVPTFVLFVNQLRFLHFSYKRYLINQLRDHFDFIGVPIVLKFVTKK
jgi:GTP-binding protein